MKFVLKLDLEAAEVRTYEDLLMALHKAADFIGNHNYIKDRVRKDGLVYCMESINHGNIGSWEVK